ncbi:MAG: polyketide synthase dehydratase domain-containing protein, partial [Desulfobulbaceae bacterium]|nr:polyketide synthase dehydratase domain-containing protein [Desulfobulbaceae bacterium]
MPAVFGLEAMAQAVAHATGERDFSRVRIKNIKFEQPITVDPETGTEIVIQAEVEEQKHDSTTRVIHALVAKSSSGIKADYFSATFELGLTDKPPKYEITIPDSPLAVQPAPDLYRETLLFQGPIFQRIEQILSIGAAGDNAEHASFKTKFADHETAAETAFPDPGHRYLFLGDPFFRDSLLQSAALLTPKETSLPVYIENLDIYPYSDKRPAIISAIIQLEHIQEREIKDTVIAVDRNGIVIERLDGYFLRILKHHDEYPSAADLIHPDERDNGIVKQALHNLSNVDFDTPTVLLRYIPGLHKLSREKRHQKELPMMQDTVRLATEAMSDIPQDFEIKWLDSGKPVIVGLSKHNIDISLSHDDRLCVCSAGTGPQGCDIAPITHRTRQEWTALLGAKRDYLFDELLDSPDSLDQAGTRIWAALEALRKATAESCDALEILHKEQNTVIFQCLAGKGPAMVLTLPFDLTWGPERILALVIQKSVKQEAAPPNSEANRYKGYENIFDKHHFKIIEGGPQGQGIFIHRFPVGFRPNAQLSRTLYFSNYVFWVGEIREASVWPVLGKIADQYSTGKWGVVTNYSHLQILGEA